MSESQVDQRKATLIVGLVFALIVALGVLGGYGGYEWAQARREAADDTAAVRRWKQVEGQVMNVVAFVQAVQQQAAQQQRAQAPSPPTQTPTTPPGSPPPTEPEKPAKK